MGEYGGCLTILYYRCEGGFGEDMREAGRVWGMPGAGVMDHWGECEGLLRRVCSVTGMSVKM